MTIRTHDGHHSALMRQFFFFVNANVQTICDLFPEKIGYYTGRATLSDQESGLPPVIMVLGAIWRPIL